MAHGRQGPDIVMNTRYVGASEVRAVSVHERRRTPDGVSAIDPARSYLNAVLHGPATQHDALEALWASGVKRPTAQAEAPYVQMVLGASPEYFRAPGQRRGQWDAARLDAWRDATMNWLRQEYGADLVHASLHLDEDTPHIHALVVPTYTKKARKPGRQKRGESAEDFERRKADAEAGAGIRTAGRSSCEKWSRPFARRHARKSYHAAVDGLGLGYGKDFIEDGEPSPEGRTTGDWVREKSAENAGRARELEAEADALSGQEGWNGEHEAWLAEREAMLVEMQAELNALKAELARREAEAARQQERMTQMQGELARRAAELDSMRYDMDQQRLALEADVVVMREQTRQAEALRSAAAADRAAAAADRAEAHGLLRHLKRGLRSVLAWLERPDLRQGARIEGIGIATEAKRLVAEVERLAPEPIEDSPPRPDF